MKYVKKPLIIEAIRYDGTTISEDEVKNFTGGIAIRIAGTRILEIPTLEGIMKVLPNDWVIKGIQGEFYPCKDDIFTRTYDEIKEPF